MDDIQNDQKTAQKADTDLEKAIVPSAHSNQQIESKKESSPNSKVKMMTLGTTKLSLPFVFGLAAFMSSKPISALTKAASFLYSLLKKRPRCPYTLYALVHGTR